MKIKMLDDFIEAVSDISDNINSDFWNGEDVMAPIFFNEFNRYKREKVKVGKYLHQIT